MLWVFPAHAHLPVLRGQLVAATRSAELIVIGTVSEVKAINVRTDELTARVEARLRGEPPGDQLHFRSRHMLAAGQRYVLFLRHATSGWESVAPSGTIFPAEPRSDADYRRAIEALTTAFTRPDSAQPEAIWAALLPALRASNQALRYNAALDLDALAEGGHPPSPSQRAQVEQLQAAKDTDPALQPLLTAILRRR